MTDFTYLVQVFKQNDSDPLEEPETIFEQSGGRDSVYEMLQSAHRAVHEDSSTRRLGSELREGDVLVSSGRVIKRILDSQTTTSGRTFILAEVGTGIETFAADLTYAVARMGS